MSRSNNGTYSRLSDDGVSGVNHPSTFEAIPPGRQDRPHRLTVGSSNNAQVFNFEKQKFSIFWAPILRWLSTAIIISFFLATFKTYEKKGSITSAQKTTFNGIVTALILVLGLSFFDAFSELAKALRWRILALARRHNSDQETALILGIEKWTKVVKLGWKSRMKPWILLFCVTWIFLILVAQTSVGLISLTCPINDGTNSSDIYMRIGTVNVTNLKCYFHDATCPQDTQQDLIQGIAHAYGEYAHGGDCGPYNEISDILNSGNNYGYYCRRTAGRQEFAYRFLEYNPQDVQGSYPSFTNRTITAAAGQCFEYPMVRNEKALDPNGNFAGLNFTYANDSFSGNIVIPFQSALSSTTYIYRAGHIPQIATRWYCGPRCMWMWAHKSKGHGENSTFYQCPITISAVNNATLQVHNVSDDIARIAAAAIGLQGRAAYPPHKWEQFQFYPLGSTWDIHNKSADDVGANMAEFALGSLSFLASRNPRLGIPGSVPYLGSRVAISWPYVIGLFAGIAGIHFAVSAAAIWATRATVDPTFDFDFSPAHVLSLLEDDLGPWARMLRDKEMSPLVGGDAAGGVVRGP